MEDLEKRVARLEQQLKEKTFLLTHGHENGWFIYRDAKPGFVRISSDLVYQFQNPTYSFELKEGDVVAAVIIGKHCTMVDGPRRIDLDLHALGFAVDVEGRIQSVVTSDAIKMGHKAIEEGTSIRTKSPIMGNFLAQCFDLQ